MSVPGAESGLPLLFEIPLVGQPFAGRFEGDRHRLSERDGLVRRLGGNGCRRLDRDGDRIGFDGIARAVLHKAVELNAVPRGIGRAGFRRLGVSVPGAESGLSLLFEIPLVSQPFAGRFEGDRHRLTEDDGLVRRLGGDGCRRFDRDGHRLRLDGIPRAVLHHAIKLYAVPCGIGRAGFRRLGVSVPGAESGLSLLFEIPLVSQPFAGRFEGDRHRLTEDDGLVRRLGGDGCRRFDRDGHRLRLDGIPRAVLHHAIKLYAVPCGIGRAGFRRLGVSVPGAESGLPLLFEIPLVGQPFAGRFEGDRHRFAERNGLVRRLGGDGNGGGKRDGRRIGFDGMPRVVLHHAIELNAVPCVIGRAGFRRLGVSVPDAESRLSLLFEIPLVGQPAAGRLDGQGQRSALLDRLALGLRGDRKHTDRRGFGIDRMPRAVRHAAVEPDAVPCGIRGAGFGGVGVTVPDAEGRLSRLFEIPLVAQSVSRRLHRQRQRLSEKNAPALRRSGHSQTGVIQNQPVCKILIKLLTPAGSVPFLLRAGITNGFHR